MTRFVAAALVGLGLATAGCGGARSEAPAWRADCAPLTRPAPLSLEAARDAQRLAARRHTLRLARRLEAQRRRPGERRAVGSPGGRLGARAPAARREAESHERRRQGPGHGTKSFGWRESDARKTRTAARPPSSSAR